MHVVVLWGQNGIELIHGCQEWQWRCHRTLNKCIGLINNSWDDVPRIAHSVSRCSYHIRWQRIRICRSVNLELASFQPSGQFTLLSSFQRHHSKTFILWSLLAYITRLRFLYVTTIYKLIVDLTSLVQLRPLSTLVLRIRYITIQSSRTCQLGLSWLAG